MKSRLTPLMALIASALVLIAALAAYPSTATGSLSGTKICLDPGHGGSDPGAVNAVFGLYESEINLDVSYALRALLEGEGAEVVMTRYDDTYRTNRDRYTFCDAQQATILVSVHTNSFTDASWDGTMTLYFQDDDRALAQAIHDVLYPALLSTAPDQTAFDDWGLSKFASGVLLKSDMPAAMMEPLFMSNPDEAALLVQTIHDASGGLHPGCEAYDCRRGEIAQGIYQGILNYFATTPPTPTPEPGGFLHVAAIDMSFSHKGPNYFIRTAVTVEDASDHAVTGATVTLRTTQPDGHQVLATGDTDDDGVATFLLKSGQQGSYTSTVVGVVKGGWVYDESANGQTEVTLEVP